MDSKLVDRMPQSLQHQICDSTAVLDSRAAPNGPSRNASAKWESAA